MSEPPRPSVVTSVGRHALEAGDEDDPVLVERLVDAVRADVDDLRLAVVVSVTIPACEPVSEIASWPRSWIAIAQSE